jgi:VanZ family protein
MTLRSPGHRSTAILLALLLGGLIGYASLYPFAGWRWPGDAPLSALMRLPMPPWRDRFDVWANFLGYMPLGMLVALAGLRSGWPAGRSWWLASLLPALLSYCMELTQQFLPGRFPSLLDWYLNAAGGLIGATLGALLQRTSLIDAWQATRDRWFIRRSDGALALLLLWPLGLLFPLPLPFGMGPSWERVQDALVGWMLDVPWAQDWLEMVSDLPVPMGRLPLIVEGLGMVLGLLGPCLLAFSVTRPGWRRAATLILIVVLGWSATTLSAAMNFGPAHALGWITPAVGPAFATAIGLALVASLLPQRVAAAVGMAVFSALMMLVAQAPADPYFSLSLQAWEQGRFIRFHGLSQWVGWLWPFLSLGWLAARIGSRDALRGLR